MSFIFSRSCPSNHQKKNHFHFYRSGKGDFPRLIFFFISSISRNFNQSKYSILNIKIGLVGFKVSSSIAFKQWIENFKVRHCIVLLYSLRIERKNEIKAVGSHLSIDTLSYFCVVIELYRASLIKEGKRVHRDVF